MQDSSLNAFGLAHLWASGDAVSHAVAVLLALMSIASWYLILVKALDWWRLRGAARQVAAFWASDSLESGLAALDGERIGSPYLELAARAVSCHAHCNEAASGQLAACFDPAGQMERALRQQLQGAQAVMENGLTLLATTGATAPFVGLFGTVWGIYHALVAIGVSGQAALEKVAGPVGEALIMTAAGLAVALPAVFAYNAFTRANRVILTGLDAFAHDLYVFFTVGKHFAANDARENPPRVRLAFGKA
ncbi:MAG: MotA/TolQ/ExbB proton channel family protein [Candidatus Accumulibacter sp.]|jgi:biopolymer transport protein ExbB|nr:MotA/TolQ/ExbB proton channel family protein [Accumulibacter sp.]